MAAALPALSPLWRNSLRLWLATSLTIGIMLWSRQAAGLFLALVMAITFTNENDSTPLRSIGQMLVAAFVGIITGLVVQGISTGWLMLAVCLLCSGALVRSLGLTKALSMAYLSSWGVTISGSGPHFTWGIAFALAFSISVGILCGQIATWVFWPHRTLQQLPGLEQSLCLQLHDQIGRMQNWLQMGGTPPLKLRSRDLLPPIQQLQRCGANGGIGPRTSGDGLLLSRWAQAGAIWGQILRQWLLLEPLLLELPAPLSEHPKPALLLVRLEALRLGLQSSSPEAASATATPQAEIWLDEADKLKVSRALLLALALQCAELEQLLRSRSRLNTGIQRMVGERP
jgi:hypothetical protein